MALSNMVDPTCDVVKIEPRVLDGVTIMRYAHVYRERASGGVEQYLRLLDRGLLHRHRMTVLQMHLTIQDTCQPIEVEKVGLGRIVWIPVPVLRIKSPLQGLRRGIGDCYREILRWKEGWEDGRRVAMAQSPGGRWRYAYALLRHKYVVLSDGLPQLIGAYGVDLVVMHWLHYDSRALMAHALESRIPVALINHFNNSRFALPEMQKWAVYASAIGGVSGVGVPEQLRSRYTHLSDAVNTEFFAPERARPPRREDSPVVLLPGRIQVGKGHLDLIKAARILMARGIEFIVCFAGAVDREPLHKALRESVMAAGLEGRVRFLGEINRNEMRDLYALSRVVVLPSYSEGVPRVLLEAQAMGKPVVAYEGGGMTEVVSHDETGFLVEKGDAEALADKIGLLLEDKQKGASMGERGRALISENFAVRALVRRHEEFYLRALTVGQRNVPEASV